MNAHVAWSRVWRGSAVGMRSRRVRRRTSIEREQAQKKGGNKHNGLERLADVQRRTRGSASLPRHARERIPTARRAGARP